MASRVTHAPTLIVQRSHANWRCPRPPKRDFYQGPNKPLKSTTAEQMVQHIVTGHLSIVALSERPLIASWDISACLHFRIALDWVIEEITQDILQPESFFDEIVLPMGVYLDDPAVIRIPLTKNLRFIELLGCTTPGLDWKHIWDRIETKVPRARYIELLRRDFSGFYQSEPDIFSTTTPHKSPILFRP